MKRIFVVLLFTALLFACAPAPMPLPTATPSATPIPIPTATPMPTATPTLIPTPSPTQSSASTEEAINKFLKGDIPAPDEELFRLTMTSKQPEKIGYAYMDEAEENYPAIGRVQLIVLGGKIEDNRTIMIAGTLDPNTGKRVVVEICIGILDTKYLTQTYVINTKTGYPYISDEGTIVAEQLPADLVTSILQANIGKPVIVSLFFAPPLNPSYESRFPDGYKEEYKKYIAGSFEANRMLLENPARLAALQKENKTFLPYTFGPIKFWRMQRNP